MGKVNSARTTCFIGTRGLFSATVFRELLEQGTSISRVFCAGMKPAPMAPKNALSVSQAGYLSTSSPEPLDMLTSQAGIPIQYITKQTELSSLELHQYQKPDLILVACFPYKLPNLILNWPKLACLNIHPSLLPRYRGPDPLFWQLHQGESQTGVSLHIITSNIDSGPIINQMAFPLGNGESRQDIEKLLAKAGASLFLELLKTNRTISELGKQQIQSKSSYNPYPRGENFEISTSWSARRAFNFIRGTCSPNGYYIVDVDNRLLKIETALDYNNEDGMHTDYVQTSNEELLIRFSPGILRVKAV